MAPKKKAKRKKAQKFNHSPDITINEVIKVVNDSFESADQQLKQLMDSCLNGKCNV